jgi:hypothetical protein
MAPTACHVGILAAAYVDLKSVLYTQAHEALVGRAADHLWQGQAAARATAEGKTEALLIWGQYPLHECAIRDVALRLAAMAGLRNR